MIHRNQRVFIQLDFLWRAFIVDATLPPLLRANNNNWKRKVMWKLPLSPLIKCLLIVFCRIFMATFNSCYTFRRRFVSSYVAAWPPETSNHSKYRQHHEDEPHEEKSLCCCAVGTASVAHMISPTPHSSAAASLVTATKTLHSLFIIQSKMWVNTDKDPEDPIPSHQQPLEPHSPNPPHSLWCGHLCPALCCFACTFTLPSTEKPVMNNSSFSV